MKIVKLNAENIKKLRAVEITPTGEIVTIAGKNGQGKTSILDSIYWALAGTGNIQSQPIRKGETKARIRLDIGELIVERKFTESGSTLIVENADGARFPSPQKMLDALLGELAFDPLAFSRMHARQQFDELRRIAKLDVDIEELDRLNKSDFAKRTDINRDAKAKRAQADGIIVPAGKETPLIDESALIKELQKAGEHNTEITERKARRDALQQAANRKKDDGVALRNRAAALREQADEADKQANAALKEAAEFEAKIDNAPPLPAPINVTELRQKIEHARTANAAVMERTKAIERKAAVIEDAKAAEAKAKTLTEQMEAREKAKLDAIANAQFPVPGLGFGNGIVTYDGLPFDQSSSAEQLRISLAIAMAANPKLRVIRITDGSLLDEDSMQAIAEAAKANDYQIWIEVVDSSGKVGLVIEDGAIKATSPESVA